MNSSEMKYSGVGRAHAHIIVAGVVLPIYEFRKIDVPIFHIETERAFFLAAALDGADRRVDDLRERRRTG